MVQEIVEIILVTLQIQDQVHLPEVAQAVDLEVAQALAQVQDQAVALAQVQDQAVALAVVPVAVQSIRHLK